jgi:hypothetical protein
MPQTVSLKSGGVRVDCRYLAHNPAPRQPLGHGFHGSQGFHAQVRVSGIRGPPPSSSRTRVLPGYPMSS